MLKFSFLILTFRSSSVIPQFIDTFLAEIIPSIKKGESEIVFVDNMSPDDTYKVTREELQKYKDLMSEDGRSTKPIRLVQNTENAGYAKGINFAASFAKGEILIIVNPDAELLNQDFEKIKEVFDENEKLAIAGLRLETYEKTTERTAGKFYNAFTFLIYSLGLEDKLSLRFAPKEARKVDFVSGGFLAVRRVIFNKLKGYDTDYFMYVEDMDLCYRARKAGFITMYLPYATIKHRGQGSSSKEFAIVNIYKGMQTFYRKHSSILFQWYVGCLLGLKAVSIIFISLILGKKEMAKTYQKALQTIV